MESAAADDHASVLEVSCDFENIPVNTYHVQAKVVGDYYTSGTAEDVLVVYDPSLGFTTGGGWFYWPGTEDKTNFGYNMKYNKKATNIQGSFLMIRHLDDGSIYRVKSNALYGLSLGESTDPALGWASFSGKATYLEPGWPEPIGNHTFVVYVEDHNEPGAGYDQLWFEVQDKDNAVIEALSMDRPAVENTVTLDRGNIVVPHNRASQSVSQSTASVPLMSSTTSSTQNTAVVEMVFIAQLTELPAITVIDKPDSSASSVDEVFAELDTGLLDDDLLEELVGPAL